MTITKEQFMETMKSLPPEFQVEEFVERLMFIRAVEEGIEGLDQGRTVTQGEIEQIVL